MLNNEKKSIWTIPNILTIFRMVMVIPFIVLMSKVAVSEDPISYSEMNTRTIQFIISGVIFAFAMFADFLDGYLARKWKQESVFGALFDPLADKWMTTSAFLLFAIDGIVPIWVVIVFILRDLLVDASKNIAAKNDIKVNASIYGKLKTVMQSLSAITLFIAIPALDFYTLNVNDWFTFEAKVWLVNIPTFIALALSVYSGYDYFRKISPYL